MDGEVSGALNETHDPLARSWVSSANAPDAEFPVQHLPYGVFRRPGDARGRVGAAIGTFVLDLEACQAAGLFEGPAAIAGEACATGRLNALCRLGPAHWSPLRSRISALLREGGSGEARSRALVEPHLTPLAAVTMELPVDVGDYTDFFASAHHAARTGAAFRPHAPLLPNYRHMPVGYHGRASSVVVSGTPVRRPWGQIRRGDEPPRFAPSGRLDYELEAAFIVGPGNALGEPIAIADAESHVFGMALLNDWSARDIQQWESQPLGPFLGKSFATSLSPWVVTFEALAPYRAPAPPRGADDPPLLPHLDGEANRRAGGLQVEVGAWLSSAAMRERGMPELRLCRSSLGDLYWTPAQMVAHHASNGCNLRPGDLLASGTISSADDAGRGCLLEVSLSGEPIVLPTGESRRFLEDGDEIVLRAAAVRDGAPRLGFGECRGIILSSREP